MGGKSSLLQRVGERVVPDVVEQRGEPDRETLGGWHELELAPFLEAAMKRKNWMQPLKTEDIPVVPASRPRAEINAVR